MDIFEIKPTTVWGDFYKARSMKNKLRLFKKAAILQNNWPIVDHFKKYCLKYKGQKGPAKESQTFIVSYPYVYDNSIGNKEKEFIETLHSINLSFYKQSCIFKGSQAYKIFIMDTDVKLENIMHLIHEDEIPIM
jgi:hypothetical protein